MFSYLKEGLPGAVKTSYEYILYPFVSCIFHWYKYCKQSKSLCLKTLFSSILSWKDQKKYKNIKIAYLFHCPFSRKTLIKSKQIHFYMFLIGSDHEPVVVRSNWISQSHKSFYPKASLLPYSWKEHVHFCWNYTSFCVFLVSFLEFSYSCFISSNFSIVVLKNTQLHWSKISSQATLEF
jgi:acetyltransferase-like isoleucine patch superfamily enzyme